MKAYHLIADYHVLTTDLNTTNIYSDTIDMLIDWLACWFGSCQQSDVQTITDKRTHRIIFDS